MKVGIFDSGLGGLSVLHKALSMCPDTNFIYYADEKHVPYGEKTREEILSYVTEILNFMTGQKCDAVIIACNTATSVADKTYRSQFGIPIVGMEPAVKKAVELYGHEDKKILVAATPITINGDKLKTLVTQVDTDHEADLVACPKLVRFAEEGIYGGAEVEQYIGEMLSDKNPDEYGSVVLGCTHFNYFIDSFKNVLGEHVHIVDGREGTIKQLMRVVDVGNISHKIQEHKVEYYISGEMANAVDMQKINSCLAQLDRYKDE